VVLRGKGGKSEETERRKEETKKKTCAERLTQSRLSGKKEMIF